MLPGDNVLEMEGVWTVVLAEQTVLAFVAGPMAHPIANFGGTHGF